MIEKKYEISTSLGLFARTASEFTRKASKFTSDIYLMKNGRLANCKSLLSVLALGISDNTDFVLKIVGDDEDLAIEELDRFIQLNIKDISLSSQLN